MKSLKEKSTVELIKMIDDDHLATELMRRFNTPQPKSVEVINLEESYDKLQNKLSKLEKSK